MAKLKKKDVKEIMLPHSQAKVEFFSAYLKRYLRIINNAPDIKKVNIYDVFCGMGIYEDGGKGSPIITFDVIKELHEDGKVNIDITMIINDLDIEKVDNVVNYVEEHNQDFCQLVTYNKDVNEVFESIISEVGKSKKDTRNIVFIDPYGYKTIKKEVLYNLMENGKTEIILFLPISHMQRFTQVAVQDTETTQYKPLRDFVLSYFEEGHNMLSNKVSVEEYIYFLKEALKYGDRFHTTSYSIQRDKSNYFALFFMSPHLYGFEKILEVKWLLDQESGRGFMLRSLEKGLFDEFFAEESQMENSDRLKEIIMSALKEPKTNGDIYELVLKNEFLPKHANEVLRDIQKTNSKFKVINMPTNTEVRKNSFYLNWKNTRKPQFIFTFAEN